MFMSVNDSGYINERLHIKNHKKYSEYDEFSNSTVSLSNKVACPGGAIGSVTVRAAWLW